MSDIAPVISQTSKLDKTTKNKVVYVPVAEGPISGVYIDKEALGPQFPQKVRIEVHILEE